jgi:ATP-binding cassette, subfamily B, bacterial PglK
MAGFWKKFFFLLGDDKKNLVLVMLAFALTSVLDVLGIGLIAPFLQLAANPEISRQPKLLQQVYIVLGVNSSNAVVKLGTLIIILFIIKAFLYLLSRTYFYYVVSHQRSAMIQRLLNAYLHAPYTFHLEKNSNLLIQNVLGGSTAYVFGLVYPILDIIVNLILTATMLFLMVRTDGFLLAMVLVVMFPIMLLFFFLRTKIKDWGTKERKYADYVAKIISHGLGGIKEVKVIGCQDYFNQQMSEVTGQLTRYSNFSNITSEVPKILIEGVLASTIVGFVIFSQVILQQNMQTVTSVMGVFAVASIRLIPSITSLIKDFNGLQGSTYAVNMVYEDLMRVEPKLLKRQRLEATREQTIDREIDFQPGENTTNRLTAITNSSQSNSVLDFNVHVKIEALNYQYSNTKELAIDNLNLELKKGQSIAFIGKSGAGKTTLVDLILGLLQPSSGDIKVDGVSIYSNFRAWQNLLGYIPQSIFLMDDTFIRNVAFGVQDDQIDYAQLDWSIRAAQLTELVEQLPDGLHTPLGERGLRLSGGQRQRIGIARALYHQREILVLDEATSALDNETEGLITESIKSLAGLKTMIVIAHRLSTIEHCDYVYALEKGKIVQSGTYAEVVANV